MTSQPRSVMLVIADPSEWPEEARVRGTGGWIDPRAREALDWATLGRLMGWSVAVGLLSDPISHPRLRDGSTFVVFACEMTDVPPLLVQHFIQRLTEEPLLLVTRASSPRSNGTPMKPAAIAKEPVGRGAIITFDVHPSVARDADGAMTRFLQQVLVHEAMRPVAWLDHSGTLVLRMDDPGGAQNVHWSHWYSRKLTEDEWQAVGMELRQRDGRLSVGYIPEWVDDGSSARGDLSFGGMRPPRVSGAVYDSSGIVYIDLDGHGPGTVHDYRSEFRGIQALRRAGLVGVELHGCTHMHPDVSAWTVAPDRYDSPRWYRELGGDPHMAQRLLDRGVNALERQFGARPSTLMCPGDEWTNEILERALDQDIHLVASYYLAIRDRASFWWCAHVCAPYIDDPHAFWFESPLPVVGYCHDRDLVLKGVEWWRDCVERWCTAGARRVIDYRQLAAELSRSLRVDVLRSGGLHLTLSGTAALPLAKPLDVYVRHPGGELPEMIAASSDDREWPIPVTRVSDAVGRLVIPC